MLDLLVKTPPSFKLAFCDKFQYAHRPTVSTLYDHEATHSVNAAQGSTYLPKAYINPCQNSVMHIQEV